MHRFITSKLKYWCTVVSFWTRSGEIEPQASRWDFISESAEMCSCTIVHTDQSSGQWGDRWVAEAWITGTQDHDFDGIEVELVPWLICAIDVNSRLSWHHQLLTQFGCFFAPFLLCFSFLQDFLCCWLSILCHSGTLSSLQCICPVQGLTTLQVASTASIAHLHSDSSS